MSYSRKNPHFPMDGMLEILTGGGRGLLISGQGGGVMQPRISRLSAICQGYVDFLWNNPIEGIMSVCTKGS